MALFIDVAPVKLSDIDAAQDTESANLVRERIIAVRNRQYNRQFCLNSQLDSKQVKQFCCLDKNTTKELQQLADKLNFSARQYFQILRVARTIADMSQSDNILKSHLHEALLYRRKLEF